MEIKELGWYRTRGGGRREVITTRREKPYSVISLDEIGAARLHTAEGFSSIHPVSCETDLIAKIPEGPDIDWAAMPADVVAVYRWDVDWFGSEELPKLSGGKWDAPFDSEWLIAKVHHPKWDGPDSTAIAYRPGHEPKGEV
jgi:hypothetical protein